MTTRESALQAVLRFVVAKLNIVLSSHICTAHGTGPCGDRDGAEEAIRRAVAVLQPPGNDIGPYSVVFCRGYDLNDRVVLSTGHQSLFEARNARQVSGDLVIWSHSGKIVNSEEWMEEWERGNPNSYANTMLQRVRDHA